MKQGLLVSWEEDFHILVWCCSWDNSSFLFAFHPPFPHSGLQFQDACTGLHRKGGVGATTGRTSLHLCVLVIYMRALAIPFEFYVYAQISTELAASVHLLIFHRVKKEFATF
jgi:hypothetical protein